jgi:hypothetical protein
VIATADFLFEMGKHDHVAEFLKANLRYGVVVRPWVYEALAVALEETKGDPEEIRRARLSAVALDPTDAQGFLGAARTMANNKQYDRALAFCRQAALLEPALAQSYMDAVAYADLAKDSRAMEWAVREIVSQDWPVDNRQLHLKAESRLQALSQTLQREERGSEAERLRAALQMLKQRDLMIVLTWDSVSGPTGAGLELEVKEPTGSVCSFTQKQTPGGGTLLTSSLNEPNRVTYTAAQAFPGDYEISVRRIWGQTVGGRARLEIIEHYGTPKQRSRIEVVRLDETRSPVKVALSGGRRSELAVVSPANLQKQETKQEARGEHVLTKLRGLAFPDFSGATGGARVRGTTEPTAASLAAQAEPSLARAAHSGVQMTSEMRRAQEGMETVLRPVLPMGTGSRPAASLPGIPGGF